MQTLVWSIKESLQILQHYFQRENQWNQCNTMTCGQITWIMSSSKRNIQDSKKLSILKIGDSKMRWNNVIRKECHKDFNLQVLIAIIITLQSVSCSNKSNNKVLVVWEHQCLKTSKRWTLIKCQEHFLFNNKCRWVLHHFHLIKCKFLHHHQVYSKKDQSRKTFHWMNCLVFLRWNKRTFHNLSFHQI